MRTLFWLLTITVLAACSNTSAIIADQNTQKVDYLLTLMNQRLSIAPKVAKSVSEVRYEALKAVQTE